MNTTYGDEVVPIWGRGNKGYPVFVCDTAPVVYRWVAPNSNPRDAYVKGFVSEMPFVPAEKEGKVFFPHEANRNEIFQVVYADEGAPQYLITFFESTTAVAAAVTDTAGHAGFYQVDVPEGKEIVWTDENGDVKTEESVFKANANLTYSFADVASSSDAASSSSVKSSSSGKSSSSAKSFCSKDKDTIVAAAASLNFSVEVAGRTLQVSGLARGARVSVFDMQGRQVAASQMLKGNGVALALPRAGSYVVCVNHQTTRVNHQTTRVEVK